MPLERPEPGYVWLHVPRRDAVEVVVVGDLHTWWAHFQRTPGARGCVAVRCIAGDGLECAWCAAQVGRRARYVFPARCSGQVRLVELGRVQYSTLAMVVDGGRWIGARLTLVREWDAANARIQVTYRGREHVSDEELVDCSDYVLTLGASAVRTVRPPEPYPCSKPAERSGSAGAVDPPEAVRRRQSQGR